MNSRSVKEDDLALFLREDSQNLVASCLRLIRYNGYLFANELVQQRRFAGVGPAEDGNKPRLVQIFGPHSSPESALNALAERMWLTKSL